MIPSKFRECQRASRRAGQTIAAALAASISAVVLTVVGAPGAFALPNGYPAEGPSEAATTTPDRHASMPGMTHDETPGMDPNMPGMSGSSGGHAHAAAEGSDSRPQAAVVGTFAVLNGGVLLTAGLMRRRARLTASKPSRASRPAK